MVVILILGKIDFNTKDVIRDKEEHYIMTKESIWQKDKTLINIYAPNRGASKYIKNMLIDI